MSCYLVRNGRDDINVIALVTEQNGEVTAQTDLSDVTRVVVNIDGTDYDSDVVGGSVIWWTDQDWYPYEDATGAIQADVVKLKLGGQSIPAGVYTNCTLTTYDPSNPSGVPWNEDLVFPVLASGASFPDGPTWAELVDQARIDLDDPVHPGMSADDIDSLVVTDRQLLDYLGRAEREACRRAKMLRDVSTSSVCSISVVDGTATYDIHESIIDIERVKLSTRTAQPLIKKNRDWLDRKIPNWETDTGTPRYWIWDGNRKQITLAPVPEEDATLSLEVTRYPLAPPCLSWVPEIPIEQRWDMLDWVYHLVYSQHENYIQEGGAKLSDVHAAKFAAIFGDRPPAELQELRKREYNRKTKAHFF